MTRVKRSLNARKKRRATLKLAKGYRGDASRHYRTAKEAVLKADQYRYRDRRNRKRDFRRLWITRINAAARQNDLSYSQFMHGLALAGVEVDRKILADIAVRDAEAFRRFADRARCGKHRRTCNRSARPGRTHSDCSGGLDARASYTDISGQLRHHTRFPPRNSRFSLHFGD